jgi:hypothetical protein
MASVSLRVIISRIDGDLSSELVEEINEDFELSLPPPDGLYEQLPCVIAEGLSEEVANDLADQLEDAGAEVIVEDDDQPFDEEAYLDDEEDLDEGEEESYDERPRRPGPKPSSRSGGQMVFIWLGGAMLLLLVVLLGVTVGGGKNLSLGQGCDSGFRGGSADEQLMAQLPRLAAQFAQGLETDDAVAHGTLANKATATLNEELEGNTCYVWLGLSPPGTDLDLFINQAGNVLDADEAEDNFPVVRRCTSGPMAVEVQALMFGGQGNWLVQRYKLRGQPDDDALSLMHRFYAAMLFDPGVGDPIGELQRLKLAAGQERAVSVQLDAQWCYSILAVGESGTDVDLALATAGGQDVASDTAGNSFPIVRHCPTESAEYLIKLGMYGGEGRVAFRLFRGKLASGGARSFQPLGLSGQGESGNN